MKSLTNTFLLITGFASSALALEARHYEDVTVLTTLTRTKTVCPCETSMQIWSAWETTTSAKPSKTSTTSSVGSCTYVATKSGNAITHTGFGKECTDWKDWASTSGITTVKPLKTTSTFSMVWEDWDTTSSSNSASSSKTWWTHSPSTTSSPQTASSTWTQISSSSSPSNSATSSASLSSSASTPTLPSTTSSSSSLATTAASTTSTTSTTSTLQIPTTSSQMTTTTTTTSTSTSSATTTSALAPTSSSCHMEGLSSIVPFYQAADDTFAGCQEVCTEQGALAFLPMYYGVCYCYDQSVDSFVIRDDTGAFFYDIGCQQGGSTAVTSSTTIIPLATPTD